MPERFLFSFNSSYPKGESMKSQEDIQKKIQDLEQQIALAFKLERQSRKKDLALIASAFLVVTRNSLEIRTLKWVLEEKHPPPNLFSHKVG